MSGEDGGNVNPSLLAQGDGDAGQPFMEMSNYSSFRIVTNILEEVSVDVLLRHMLNIPLQGTMQ